MAQKVSPGELIRSLTAASVVPILGVEGPQGSAPSPSGHPHFTGRNWVLRDRNGSAPPSSGMLVLCPEDMSVGRGWYSGRVCTAVGTGQGFDISDGPGGGRHADRMRGCAWTRGCMWLCGVGGVTVCVSHSLSFYLISFDSPSSFSGRFPT